MRIEISDRAAETIERLADTGERIVHDILKMIVWVVFVASSLPGFIASFGW